MFKLNWNTWLNLINHVTLFDVCRVLVLKTKIKILEYNEQHSKNQVILKRLCYQVCFSIIKRDKSPGKTSRAAHGIEKRIVIIGIVRKCYCLHRKFNSSCMSIRRSLTLINQLHLRLDIATKHKYIYIYIYIYIYVCVCVCMYIYGRVCMLCKSIISFVTRLTKAWTAIDKLSVIWKSDLTDKMKRSFFQAAVVSILLDGCTTWTLKKWLEKRLDGNSTRMVRAILNKSRRQHPTKQHLYGHLRPITKTIKIRRTRHGGAQLEK